MLNQGLTSLCQFPILAWGSQEILGSELTSFLIHTLLVYSWCTFLIKGLGKWKVTFFVFNPFLSPYGLWKIKALLLSDSRKIYSWFFPSRFNDFSDFRQSKSIQAITDTKVLLFFFWHRNLDYTFQSLSQHVNRPSPPTRTAVNTIIQPRDIMQLLAKGNTNKATLDKSYSQHIIIFSSASINLFTILAPCKGSCLPYLYDSKWYLYNNKWYLYGNKWWESIECVGPLFQWATKLNFWCT